MPKVGNTDGGRFLLVDGLRGIAAMWVVLFHLYEKNLLTVASGPLPEPLHSILKAGNHGVDIFFVLSGFVIAYSIRNARITPEFFGRFALRRSIRLDLPYWATIASAVVLLGVTKNILARPGVEMPTLTQIAGHLCYAQGFLQMPQIVGVFWTLCLEIQFYLVVVALMGIAQMLEATAGEPPPKAIWRWMLFGPLWIWSLAVASGQMSVVPGLFTTHWPYFFIGVMAYWTTQRAVRPAVLVAFLASFVLALWHTNSLGVVIALATAVGLYQAAGNGRLYTLSLTPVAQYLGRISYSLYLTHMLTGCRAVRFVMERYSGGMSQTHVLVMMALGIAVSVVAAQVFYVVVEKSAINLSRRVSLAGSSWAWRQHATGQLGRLIAMARPSH